MLAREENEILTQVGPETPMGEMFRRYWIPALLSEEIPEPDGAPVRVKLLGEDLVAFRDSGGKVGLLDEFCSHRRASLFYGRNEACGLRCIYHGWKFDTEGNVLETPAEPAKSQFRDKVRHRSYPCHEAAGVVFAYMGPREEMPQFPQYEWLRLSPPHVHVFKYRLECNYLQALEGDCDPAHLGILHRGNAGLRTHAVWTPKSFEVAKTPVGLRSVTLRERDDGPKNLRVSNFVMPFLACVDVGYPDGYMVVYQGPADDHQTTRYNFRFRRATPLSQEEIEGHCREMGPDFTLRGNRRNNYLMNRDNQRHHSYTGIQGFTTQDACVTESMGSICDRTQEHLGTSDTFIIALRRFLSHSVKDFLEGRCPPGISGRANEMSSNVSRLMES